MQRSEGNIPSDTDYLSAVKAGDIKAAQRMVDEAAKAAGYTVGPVFHGTAGDFNEFKPSRIGNFGPGIYLAFDSDSAASYAKRIGGNRVIQGYVKANNPIVGKDATDAANKLFSQFPGSTDNESVSKAKAAGYDSVIATGTLKTKFGDSPAQMSVFDATQIKSAEPITRDDQGNVIPLSKRFQAESPDIRYQRGEEDATRKFAERVMSSRCPSDSKQRVLTFATNAERRTLPASSLSVSSLPKKYRLRFAVESLNLRSSTTSGRTFPTPHKPLPR